MTIQDRTQLNCQRAVSDTTSTSESDVGEDFSARFGKSFLLGSRTSPPKRESIFKKTESMNLLSFVFVNGSVIIFTIHWHVGYYHMLLWCIRRLFFHEIFDNSVFVRLSDVFMNPKLSKDRLPHTMVTMVMMLQAEKSFCLVDFKPLYVPRNLHP